MAAQHRHVVFFFIARVDDQEGGGHLHGGFLARVGWRLAILPVLQAFS
jgi:hypothetical protein